MVTRQEWEAGAPIAITSADVPRDVAAYRLAEQHAEQVRELLAEARQPHRARDVCAGLDIATDEPRVLVGVQDQAHRRTCENVLSLLPPGQLALSWRARRRNRRRRARPPASA